MVNPALRGRRLKKSLSYPQMGVSKKISSLSLKWDETENLILPSYFPLPSVGEG
jgi:hypothetical protein